MIEGYNVLWNNLGNKNYVKDDGGIMVLSRYAPLRVLNGVGVKEIDVNGRVMTVEYE